MVLQFVVELPLFKNLLDLQINQILKYCQYGENSIQSINVFLFTPNLEHLLWQHLNKKKQINLISCNTDDKQ